MPDPDNGPPSPRLLQRMLAISRALGEAGLDHAFGGGLILPLYGRVRATDDIDVGVFVAVDRMDDVFGALGRLGVDVDLTDEARAQVRAGEWVTLHWGSSPVDVFFSSSPEALAARKRVVAVTMANQEVPVLSLEDFVAHKALFGRTGADPDDPDDWADIESVMRRHPEIDLSIVAEWLHSEGRGNEIRWRLRKLNAIARRCGATPVPVPSRWQALRSRWVRTPLQSSSW